jgi:hypothetical protein
MNKYRIFFAGNPGLEMIVAGYDMASVVNQYQWSGPGPMIRIEYVGSTNVQDTTLQP